MFTASFAPGASPQIPTWHPAQSSLSSFWQSEDVHEHLRKLKETVGLAKALKTELEEILRVRRSRDPNSEGVSLSLDCPSPRELSNDSIATGVSRCFEDESIFQFLKLFEAKRISLDVQESLSMEAANTLLSTLKYQLVPLNGIMSQAIPWEEKSAAVKFANKLQKSKRNKLWKKRKRKRVAELSRKLREDYDKADQDADEWRAREIAKDMARHKVLANLSMVIPGRREIAKLKSREERKRLESELELFLVVEKLQELHSIRIQKLKKQGKTPFFYNYIKLSKSYFSKSCTVLRVKLMPKEFSLYTGHFIPEEDDKFLERVRAAVEEEERQAAAAADTHAAKDAIATAESSRKVMQNAITEANSIDEIEGEPSKTKGQSERSLVMDANMKSEQQKDEALGWGSGYDSVSNLPFEFFHYYYGSSNDMGTLIEVRRTWDAYIRPGGRKWEHCYNLQHIFPDTWTLGAATTTCRCSLGIIPYPTEVVSSHGLSVSSCTVTFVKGAVVVPYVDVPTAVMQRGQGLPLVAYGGRSSYYRSVAFSSSIVSANKSGQGKAMANAGGAAFRWVLQLHRDVPRAARFYSEGLDFSVNVCTLRWAELQSGPLKLALMHSPSDITMKKGYSSMLSFTVADMNSTVTKLMSLGAELDGPIKYEIHGKVAALRCLDGHMLGLYEPVLNLTEQAKQDHAVLLLAKLNAQLGSSPVHE
ncbi:hypothetical protein C4D60_Mb09t25220 [Musa balbisiana]|uniref:Glyoxalase/fosfomycin resistance/dioxygenase domain-containing protein n=1 Tax=Musa balbisiana TaxID=52838 RepID=A0A4S8ILE3_MUSBA|nr:hypothetical protein C4D60_Mb09t25220 [Musa balbisiana]